jgi:hypothetical protein
MDTDRPKKPGERVIFRAFGENMQLTISSVDYAPEELYDQVPIVAELIRELPGDDRPDYWLAKSQRPIKWIKDNVENTIIYIILAARWAGTQISPGVDNLPVGIAYVIDETLLQDPRLDFKKCVYVAIGISSETSGGNNPPPLTSVLAGRIGRAFGVGKVK